MQLFKKKRKDKRYNSQLDNYTDKYADTFKLGLVYALILLLCYGLITIYSIYIK